MNKEKFVNMLARISALFTIVACILSMVPTTAFAASTMKMDKSSKTLYLNEDNSTDTPTKYDFSIKNKPAGYKTKYTFKWYAEDKSIVDVSNGGVVTAKKVGQTTVKCDIKTKSNGKLYTTASAVVTVKANASSVEITNAPEGNKMQVGETFDFNRTMKNKFGGKATDKTMWVLDCSEGVATVDKDGVVEALEPGTFKLYAQTYQSSATKDIITAASEPVEITIQEEADMPGDMPLDNSYDNVDIFVTCSGFSSNYTGDEFVYKAVDKTSKTEINRELLPFNVLAGLYSADGEVLVPGDNIEQGKDYLVKVIVFDYDERDIDTSKLTVSIDSNTNIVPQKDTVDFGYDESIEGYVYTSNIRITPSGVVSDGDNGSVLSMQGSDINIGDVLDISDSREVIAIPSGSESDRIIIMPYMQTESGTFGLNIGSLTEQEKPVSIILDSESKCFILNLNGINGEMTISGDIKLPEMRLRCNSRITLESSAKKHSLEIASISVGCELIIEDGILIKGINSDVSCCLEDEDSVLNIGALAAGSGKINVIIEAVGARVCINPASANNVSVSGEGVILNSLKDIDGNIIYTATETSSYDIILNPCQGTVETPTLSYKHGTEIGELPVPSRNGYTFDGWYTEETGGDLIEADLEVTEPLAIYAHWTKNPATGDDTRYGMAMVMMMLSIGGIAAAKKRIER